MQVLIFDTETTGLVDRKEPPGHPKQPDLVQLAYVVVDPHDDWEEIETRSVILRLPDGVTVPDEAASVHGITTERTIEEGIEPSTELMRWVVAACDADVLVAHNMSFDRTVVSTAMVRNQIPVPEALRNVLRFCTMAATEPILKLPFPRGGRGLGGRWKWPKLEEAYRHYTGKDLVGAHDALVDVRACAVVLRALDDAGLFALQEAV